MTTVYFAQPIDFTRGTPNPVAGAVFDDLTGHGYNVYRPITAWTCGGEPEPAIQRVNDGAIRHCDALVAILPPDTVTVGTPMEIQSAAQMGKPVVVVTPLRSFALAGLIGVAVVEDPHKAVPALRDMLAQREAARREMATPTGWGPLPEPFDEFAHRTPMVYERVSEYARDLGLHHEGDAGWDLAVTETVTVEPHSYKLVAAGVKIAWPAGMWGLILPRSSTLKNLGLMVSPAVIDNGWRGGYYTAVWNLTDRPVDLVPGDRLAQVVPFALAIDDLAPVLGQVLADTARGENGFGSTNNPGPPQQQQ